MHMMIKTVTEEGYNPRAGRALGWSSVMPAGLR
jgi:hypothetical protein